jgi:hypothetical protein
MVNFYRRFLPGIGYTLQPLTDALKGDPKRLEWPPATGATFQAAKDALAAAVPLAHPAPNAVLSLATNASDTHVPVPEQVFYYIYYFSRILVNGALGM